MVPETSSKYVSADDPRWDSPWQKSGDMIGFGYEAQMADEKQGDLWAQIIADHGTGEGFLRHEQLEELTLRPNEDEVSEVLSSLGLQKYAETFRENGFDSKEVLLEMEEAHMGELGL